MKQYSTGNTEGNNGNNEVMPLAFNGVTIATFNQDNQIWMTSSDLAQALGYETVTAITKLYNRNKTEFSDSMTQVLDLNDRPKMGRTLNSGAFSAKTRIFSLRGCHMIAMFARTDIAKAFRVWVLDILDEQVGTSIPAAESTAIKPISDYSHADFQKLKEVYKIPELAKVLGVSEIQAIQRVYQSYPKNQTSQPSLFANDGIPPHIQKVLAQFWDTVSQLDLDQINHSNDPKVLAISLPEVYQQAGDKLPPKSSMLTALKNSLIPRFKDSNHAINSRLTGSTKKTWVFLMPNDEEA